MQTYLSMPELEATHQELGTSPKDNGTLEMIICRPASDERQVLDQAELDVTNGLVGDNWRVRGSALLDAQIAIMNIRVIKALTPDASRWALAGDQLFVDLDLSVENLVPGQRLAIGTAVLEITELPHTGCAKFTERFGHDAIRFVNSAEGRQWRRRGVYARVVQPGTIRSGDNISKIETR